MSEEMKEQQIESKPPESTPVEQAKAPEVKDQENSEDVNWKAFREARKKDRAEKEAAERKAADKEAEVAALKAAMEAAFSKNTPTTAQRTDYQSYGFDETESEEEKFEKKVREKVKEELSAFEQRMLQQQQQREHQEYPQRLSQSYPDFNSVVTEENLDYLEYHYPEIARPLKRQNEGFDKWSDTYHALKKLVPNAANAKREAQKAAQNGVKPRSMSSQGITQPQEMKNILSDSQKAANWERMQRTLKGLS